MRTKVVWGVLFIIFSVLVWQIAVKERIIKNGTTMYLALAPRDPRSLIQGDYMRLAYAVERTVNTQEIKASGRLVVGLDPNHVARFIRLDNGEPLAGNEYYLKYKNRRGMRIGAGSFFFQAGQAKVYQGARYGELKVSASGDTVLIGLRDPDLKRLGADKYNKKQQ